MSSGKRIAWIVLALLIVSVVWAVAAHSGMNDETPAEPSAQSSAEPSAGSDVPAAAEQLLTPEPGETLAPDADVSQIHVDSIPGANAESEPMDPSEPWSVLTDTVYQVSIRMLNPWTGAFWEDGSDDAVIDCLAMQFRNDGDRPIQYAEYTFSAGEETRVFRFTDLPPGQSCVVLETNRAAYADQQPLRPSERVVASVDALPRSEALLLVDNGDNTISIVNRTDREISRARVFFKFYYEQEQTFLGGITYTAEAEQIPANGSVTIAPPHFESGVSVFLGSGVYE